MTVLIEAQGEGGLVLRRYAWFALRCLWHRGLRFAPRLAGQKWLRWRLGQRRLGQRLLGQRVLGERAVVHPNVSSVQRFGLRRYRVTIVRSFGLRHIVGALRPIHWGLGAGRRPLQRVVRRQGCDVETLLNLPNPCALFRIAMRNGAHQRVLTKRAAFVLCIRIGIDIITHVVPAQVILLQTRWPVAGRWTAHRGAGCALAGQ